MWTHENINEGVYQWIYQHKTAPVENEAVVLIRRQNPFTCEVHYNAMNRF